MRDLGCGLDPNRIDLYKVHGKARNAYATGEGSIAITTHRITDHQSGAISDRALSAVLCHEVGHLVTRSVRVAPMTTWFAMPWRSTYRLAAKIVLPIAARQPRFLLALVVIAVLTIAIGQGIHEHQWGSVAALAGIVISVLTVPAIDAAASRAGDYAADQFAARSGYGNDLSRTLLNIVPANGADALQSRILSRHPRPAHRVQRLQMTSETAARSVWGSLAGQPAFRYVPELDIHGGGFGRGSAGSACCSKPGWVALSQ